MLLDTRVFRSGYGSGCHLVYMAGLAVASYCRRPGCGADEGVRTPGLDHGKVALYQLSYIRVIFELPGAKLCPPVSEVPLVAALHLFHGENSPTVQGAGLVRSYKPDGWAP